MRTIFRRAAATAAILVFLTGTVSAATVEVKIKNFKFSPADITVAKGDTIVWDNQDIATHTATARDKSFDVTIKAGQKGSVVVKDAGTFDYFCRFHPMMKGQVVVK